MPIPLPPKEEQRSIVETLGRTGLACNNATSQLGMKLTLLTQLKQSLLHKAFTGELTTDQKAVDRALSEAGV